MYKILSTEFYDLQPHHNHDEAVAFYVAHASVANGSILEPMCGSGRFLVPLLAAGHDVEGFDASPHMLAALAQRCCEAGITKNPAWQQFVQDFESTKQYRMMFIPYGSWGLVINPDDRTHGLQRLHDHLEPGGRLFLEIETVDSVPDYCGVPVFQEEVRADGSTLRLDAVMSYAPESQLFTSDSRYQSRIDGTVVAEEKELFEQYLFQYDEMDRALSEVGFAQIHKYQDYKKTPPKEGVPIIIYECIK